MRIRTRMLLCVVCVLTKYSIDSITSGTSIPQTTLLEETNEEPIDATSGLDVDLEGHPDPNDENHEGMVYVGRLTDDGTRVGFDVDNGIRYIFGTGFDKTHTSIAEEDMHHVHYGPDAHHDVASRGRGKTREQILQERRHGDPNEIAKGPKPFGYHETHPLDGGRDPPMVVHVDPFFMDLVPVTNKEFGKFVKSTYYKTEAEHFGWSFVLSSFLPNSELLKEADVDPQAEDWVVVNGAYWRAPEGPGSSYKYRVNHPVSHISHRDAAEYCTWRGKRLPGEWEWEAAARAGMVGPHNRTLYSWGDEQTIDVAKNYANLWGDGDFPWTNHAEDGWRGTSPVRAYPPNPYGFYDMTGNVWEWMRGGKHKDRIVRGASYVDSLDGSFNHAATIGARATLHGTTAAGNVGFRCAKSPKRPIEYHEEGPQPQQLTVEDQFGKRHMVPNRGNEEQFDNDDEFEDEWDSMDGRISNERKVVKPRVRLSNEL